MIRTSYCPGEWDFPALYESGQWEPDTRAALEKYLHPGTIFWDVGAWVGPVTLWAIQLGARVIAWEPDKTARQILRLNTTNMDVETRPEAWSSTMGQGWLNPDQYFGDSSARLGTYRPDGYAVLKTTPKKAFQDYSHRQLLPDLIKLDIEGGETDVLPTLGPLCVAHRVPLLVSCHQPWWQSELDPAWSDGLTLDQPFEAWNNVLCVPA